MHGTSTRNNSISCMHELTNSVLFQKYELMEYGYDQSLLIRPEADDGPDQCMLASLSYLTLPYLGNSRARADFDDLFVRSGFLPDERL
jgi:hypothetical protein